MKKEGIIVGIIFGVIIVLNIITQKYTNVAMTDTLAELDEVREATRIQNKEMAEEKMTDTMDKWNNVKEKFVIYIEHDELEKVELQLNETKSNIETEEYAMAVESIDACKFIIKHIKEKYEFSLENIF